ncbi:MAG: TlpA family protein disulfide reductase [Deltaproteobacteria bacterium]|nr:TlpA family protein disulfide reductase [Deltaproteobacteria bacterium]
MARFWLSLLLAVSLLAPSLADGKRKYGIHGHKAPKLNVGTWFNLPKGKKSIDLPELRGKVVYLLFFQSWCPACHSHGLPRMKKLVREYEKKDVVFLVIQTVFEGYAVNTPAKAEATRKQFGLDIPVGHDGGPERSRVMRRYRTGGTPWVVVIDKEGIVRFDDYFLANPAARKLLDRLGKEQHSENI